MELVHLLLFAMNVQGDTLRSGRGDGQRIEEEEEEEVGRAVPSCFARATIPEWRNEG